MKSNNIKLTSVDMEPRQKLDFKAGDTVSVWSKIVDEKGKARLQAFEGIVLARKHGTEIGATFTLRKVASGVGVERIFPLYSPTIEKIEVSKRSRSRRSKLYYIRDKAVKDVRRKMRSVVLSADEVEAVDEGSMQAKTEEKIVEKKEKAPEAPATKEESKEKVPA